MEIIRGFQDIGREFEKEREGERANHTKILRTLVGPRDRLLIPYGILEKIKKHRSDSSPFKLPVSVEKALHDSFDDVVAAARQRAAAQDSERPTGT